MPDRLAEIRARLDMTSERPWTNSDGWIVCGGTTRYYVTGHTTLVGDAEFIAHAPADIAWLLNEVDTLRERVAILRAEVADLEGLDA